MTSLYIEVFRTKKSCKWGVIKVRDQNVSGPRNNGSHIKNIESTIVLIKEYLESEIFWFK